MRLDFLNRTSLRNDIEVFAFNREADAFGNDGARIESVCLADARGTPLSWVVGGEETRLTVVGRARQALYSPIAGFFLKNRLGQELFGDNTYLAYQDRMPYVPEGGILKAHFRFFMPVLPAGEYVVAAALAEGTQARHIQLCWMHNALLLHSHSSSSCTGMIGIPMQDIRLEVA
jgi:lipopolysaccharide transport system ATP-binding protein